ncbi:hypothetical protein H920_16347 [Fukomys damarensis]|uniref:Uncharacterized protein n=1 Tax=Fukomys damarensis TaxID=885580 RepID=A0A091CUT2_FUKDA|nr:hypothetical protein H920_16347 [Fukomys damarensis]
MTCKVGAQKSGKSNKDIRDLINSVHEDKGEQIIRTVPVRNANKFDMTKMRKHWEMRLKPSPDEKSS